VTQEPSLVIVWAEDPGETPSAAEVDLVVSEFETLLEAIHAQGETEDR